MTDSEPRTPPKFEIGKQLEIRSEGETYIEYVVKRWSAPWFIGFAFTIGLDAELFLEGLEGWRTVLTGMTYLVTWPTQLGFTIGALIDAAVCNVAGR